MTYKKQTLFNYLMRPSFVRPAQCHRSSGLALGGHVDPAGAGIRCPLSSDLVHDDLVDPAALLHTGQIVVPEVEDNITD